MPGSRVSILHPWPIFRMSNKHRKRIGRINITPCNGREKREKKREKRLENDYRHFFSAVSSGMSRILIPKGEHTVKVALGTPLSDLIKYLESIRDFLLPRPPFNRARITFWLPCCGFRPRKKYGKEGETIALYKLIGGNTSSGDYYTYTHVHTRPGAYVSRELSRLQFHRTRVG